MTKKYYMQPTIQVVKIHTAGMLAVSGTSTSGLNWQELNYDENGGNQNNAW
jgi:hypothetical protein